MVHAPYEIVDTDSLGGLYIRDSSVTTASLTKQLKMQLGYGVPVLGWPGEANWENNKNTLLPLVKTWDSMFPHEVPTRIVKNNWVGYDTLITYSNGAKIEYTDSTSSLVFTPATPSTPAGCSSNIKCSVQ